MDATFKSVTQIFRLEIISVYKIILICAPIFTSDFCKKSHIFFKKHHNAFRGRVDYIQGLAAVWL